MYNLVRGDEPSCTIFTLAYNYPTCLYNIRMQVLRATTTMNTIRTAVMKMMKKIIALKLVV